jgi:predicted Zn-dependent protease
LVLIKTSYDEDSFEIAIRDGSLEVNSYHGEYLAYRKYTESSIVVVSMPKNSSFNYEKYLGSRIPSSHGGGRVFLEEFYSGSYRVGEELILDDGIDLVKSIYDRVKSKGLGGEVILVSRHSKTQHSVEEYNTLASEDRWVHELYIYIYALYMGTLLSTGKVLAVTNLKSLSDKVLDIILNNMYNQIVLQARARRFNPLHSGSWKTLLTGDAACVFFHELTHLLQADEPIKYRVGTVIGGELKIIEDPFYPGPLQRMFDDEVYPAWRRVLVEDGRVVDYLRTRLTSNGSRPGNGRGLFTKPKPLYHQLIVASGDWSIDEALSEHKRIIVVENIVKAELYNGYIRIIPENGILYEKESAKPIKGFEIRIPINKLNELMIGLTTEHNTRYSYEKNHPIYEVAPSTIIEARITT